MQIVTYDSGPNGHLATVVYEGEAKPYTAPSSYVAPAPAPYPEYVAPAASPYYAPTPEYIEPAYEVKTFLTLYLQ